MIATRPLVVALGTAQTVAWGSSFYLPAMLAAPMAQELGTSPSRIYLLLSMALVLSALLSPWAGRRIDRHGGRTMLMASNGLFAAGLLLLAMAPGLPMLAAGWLLLGLAMGCGLYDAAFAALVRHLGGGARRAISGVTLIAGFASTVGWPLSAAMDAAWGWRAACVGWAALHLLLALPLNRLLPAAAAPDTAAPAPAAADTAPPSPAAASPAATALPAAPAPARRGLLFTLALMFACWGFVSTSIATHLPALLLAGGVPLAGAVALAALAGPSQVAARVIELGLLSRGSPLLTARLAAAGHPLAALTLLLLGAGAALPFVVLHGLGNGLLTIVRGTLPLALFGAQGYGARQGWIALPGRLLGAASPWLMGLLIEATGLRALWLTAALGCAALALLLMLRMPRAEPPAGPG